ncbi:MAG: DUF4129 domain-containing protein [Bacteroidota bacterium]
MKVFQCLLILLLLGFSNILLGNDASSYVQEEKIPVEVNKADWEKVAQDLEYGEGVWTPKPQREKMDLEWLGGLLKVLAIIGVIVLIVLLLRFFVGAQGIQQVKNRTFDPNEKINTHTVADNIHEYDLPQLIQQAIAQKDFSAATRLYYLLAIKSLSEKGLIQWKKDKTNRKYLQELSNQTTKQQFRQLTTIFERIWYGEVVVDEAVFEQIQPQFQQFVQNFNGGNELRTD